MRYASRVTPWLLAALMPALPFVPAARASSWERVDEISGGPAQRVLVNGKPRVYVLLAERGSLTVVVQGPARLKAVTRAAVKIGTSGAVAYTMSVIEGSRAVSTHATQSGPAPDASLPSDPKTGLTKARDFEIPVPEGEHHYALSVTGVPAVYVRLMVAAPKRTERMVSIAPVEAARSVTLSEGQLLIPYYTVFPDKALRFRIVGPTQMELSARLDFDETMRGEQHYVLLVSSAKVPLRELRFRTSKATSAAYTDLKNRVPSKVDRVVLSLGAGSHEITVELREPRGGSAEVHMRIPERGTKG
jgi:hypothetical protein